MAATFITTTPASADRIARRQFQATGQPVSQTQASDAMTSRLPCYEAKCVQHRCFHCGSVPLRSDIKGTELPLPIYWYHSKGNWLRYNFCRWQFLYNETLQQTFRPLLSKLSKRRQILGTLSPFWGSYWRCRTLIDDLLESPCRVLVKCSWT